MTAVTAYEHDDSVRAMRGIRFVIGAWLIGLGLFQTFHAEHWSPGHLAAFVFILTGGAILVRLRQTIRRQP